MEKNGRLIVLFVGLSLAYSVGTLFDLFPHGLEGEWEWGGAPLPLSGSLLLPILVAGGVVALFLLALRGAVGGRIFVSASVLLQFLFVGSFCYLYPERLTHFVATILSRESTGHLQGALRFPSAAAMFTDRYAESMHTLPIHSHTHLPGAILLYRLAIDFFRDHPAATGSLLRLASALGFDREALARFAQAPDFIVSAAFTMGIFYLAMLSLSVVTVHLLAKELFGERVALLAVPLWILVPATVSFFPQLDLVYPALSAGILVLLLRHLRTGNVLWMVACSLATAAGLFFSFAFAVMIALCGLVYLAHALRAGLLGRDHLRRHTRALAGFVAPLGLAYLALYAFGELSILDAFEAAMATNERIQARFTWWRWATFYTWYDFFSFAGATASLLFLHVALRTLRDAWRGEAPAQAHVLAAYLAVLVLLVAQGAVVTEVARIWIFLMPFLVVFAAAGAQELTRGRRLALLAILGSALLQVIAFKTRYEVMIELRRGFGGL